MFSKIAVALNDLPESQRALRTAIDLCRLCEAELSMISIVAELPVYSSFAVVADPASHAAMMEERRNYCKEILEKAEVLARGQGVRAHGSIVVGNEVRAVLHFLKEQSADLLVVGLHQHDFYLSRLWSSVYDLAQEATCSVLGVH